MIKKYIYDMQISSIIGVEAFSIFVIPKIIYRERAKINLSTLKSLLAYEIIAVNHLFVTMSFQITMLCQLIIIFIY